MHHQQAAIMKEVCHASADPSDREDGSTAALNLAKVLDLATVVTRQMP
jgi:hypothetical protein